MTRNLVMRTMGDGGQCHPCIHLRRCDSLAGTAGGEGDGEVQGGKGEWAGGRGVSAAPPLPVPALLEFRSTLGR